MVDQGNSPHLDSLSHKGPAQRIFPHVFQPVLLYDFIKYFSPLLLAQEGKPAKAAHLVHVKQRHSCEAPLCWASQAFNPGTWAGKVVLLWDLEPEEHGLLVPIQSWFKSTGALRMSLLRASRRDELCHPCSATGSSHTALGQLQLLQKQIQATHPFLPSSLTPSAASTGLGRGHSQP